MVPGIVGLLLMMITLILTSLAVVKEKEIGTLEQLIVTPINILSINYWQVRAFRNSWICLCNDCFNGYDSNFRYSRGSYVFLSVSSFIYIVSTLGLGLFVYQFQRRSSKL